MKLTTLFRLRKPDGTDPVNIEDFNDNFDVIDEELGKRLESTGAASDMTVAFEQASARTNLKTGEKISVSFGKIMKWFADLKTVAFSGSYNDLTSKPTIPSGAAASQAVANNCTTTAAGSVLDARQGKVLMDKANQLSSELDNSNRLTMLFDDGLYPQEVGETLTYNIKQDINEYKEMLFLCSMDSDCLREIRVPIALSNVRLGVSYYVDESYNCALEIIFNWTNKLLTVYLRNRKGYSTVGVNQIFGIK